MANLDEYERLKKLGLITKPVAVPAREAWVMGTALPKPQLPVVPPTTEEKAAWQKAQDDYTKLSGMPAEKSIYDYSPFKFENPLPAIQKAYTDAGGGAAGVGAVLGNRVAAGIGGAVDMAKPDTEPGLISGFTQGLGTSAKPVASTRPVETQTQTPVGLPIGGGITVTGANTSGRAGFSPRTYRDASGNVVASGVSIRCVVAPITSRKLCGGMLVAIPTAIPNAPFNRRFGAAAGRTVGSFLVPS